MKLKVFLSFVLAGALLLTAVPSAGASSNTAGEDLSKTGTTYEYIDVHILFSSTKEGLDAGFEDITKEIPELSVEAEKTDSPSVKLEVRYASVFSVSQAEARKYGYSKYQEVINGLVATAKKQGIVLSGDIDDKTLQAFAKRQFLLTEDPDVIAFIKFIDIYENYDYNIEMRKLASAIETREYASTDDLLSDEDLFTLLSMMPVTINGTAENGSDDGNDKNSETGLPGYDANAAVGYAYSWWNKTNNTTYGYYARYNNHPDPTNNNMWSEGTGNNYRTWADCANYVSQCLAAGGAQQIKKGLILPHTRTGNWYYSDSKPSHTWGGASNFFNHWSDRVGTRSSASQTKKGDPFSVDYGGDDIPDHTLIITSVSGTSLSNMKFACHTADQYEASGKSLQTIYNTSEKVWIYKVG